MIGDLEGNTTASATPRWVGIAVVLMAAASIAGLGFAWSATGKARAAENAVTTEVQSLQRTLDGLQQRLEKSEETNAVVQGELAVVTDKLKLTESELARARGQARQIRDEYGKQLSDVENSVQTELATKASSTDVTVLGSNLSDVRNDLDATKQHLNLARGELGTLIARNSDELDQLRRLGIRDYFEFSLEQKGTRQKMGSITVELRGTNTKRNQFTVALYVDDLRLEKKNRSINEPIYFYARGYKAPLELVVNEVAKNRVIGYLSVPKPAAGPTSASNTGS